MSNFMQATALIIIGGVAGVGGFALMSKSDAAPQQVAATPTVVAELDPPPVTEPESAEVIEVSYATTGSVESDAPYAAFSVFRVSASDDVGEVVLTVSGSSGSEVDEAVGQEFTKSGTSLTVNIGDMGAGEEREVVVSFSLSDDAARFKTHTAFRDLHTGELQKVSGATQGHSISRRLQEPDVYEKVRKAYSRQAIAIANGLIDDQEYKEALTWVDDAYARNVEVGMALRLTGELAKAQSVLSNKRDELEELNRPKRVVKRRKAKPIEIDFVRGDT